MNLQKLFVQSLLWRSVYFISVMLVNIFLSRYLQASVTGWLYYISNIFGLLQLVLGFSMDASITYFAAAKIIQPKKLLMLAVVWSIAAAIIVYIFSFIFFKCYHFIPPAEQKMYLTFALLYVSGFVLMNAVIALFYANSDFIIPNIILALVNILLY